MSNMQKFKWRPPEPILAVLDNNHAQIKLYLGIGRPCVLQRAIRVERHVCRIQIVKCLLSTLHNEISNVAKYLFFGRFCLAISYLVVRETSIAGQYERISHVLQLSNLCQCFLTGGVTVTKVAQQ